MTQDLNQERTACPECGAPMVDGMTCWEQLGAIIAWEGQDPELLAEHFLTVASYNLQHPAQYTEEVIAGLRVAVIDYLDHGVSTAQLRRRAAYAYEGSKRVLRDKVDWHPVLRHWPLTIAHVYLPDQPAGAAARVRAWGAAIRREL